MSAVAEAQVKVMNYEDWLEANTGYDSDCHGCGSCAMYYNDNHHKYQSYLEQFSVKTYDGKGLFNQFKLAIRDHVNDVDYATLRSDDAEQFLETDVNNALGLFYKSASIATINKTLLKRDQVMVAKNCLDKALTTVSGRLLTARMLGVSWQWGPENRLYLKDGRWCNIKPARETVPGDDFGW